MRSKGLKLKAEADQRSQDFVESLRAYLGCLLGGLLRN